MLDITLSSNITSPPVGSYKRIIVLPVVDLPEPDSPTKPNVSPSYIWKDTSSTAFTTLFLPKGKYCFKFLTSNKF